MSLPVSDLSFEDETNCCVAQDMNYTVVINGALWIGALVYYMVYAKKNYQGPQTTVAPEDEGRAKAAGL